MYQPAHFREDKLEVQHALIRAHPLGLLVTNGKSGLTANLLPFVLDATTSPHGTLKCHLARANPQWQEFDPAQEALVVFQGVERYITPSWYVTKRETGKVVPTWNYAVVQAYGRITVRDDHDWLAQQIRELTMSQEQQRAQPWAVEDAPSPFVDAQIRAIVGLEIPLARIEGKWKVSQNRPERDRATVIDGLNAEADEVSQAMAELVAARAPAK
ncbi:MAG TPA: FMN-binding negative transcriptional regulator [Pseudolabrys sp.]|nr:FMN-binding negative transcriptional regulator [Pseudolabrys sp.]